MQVYIYVKNNLCTLIITNFFFSYTHIQLQNAFEREQSKNTNHEVLSLAGSIRGEVRWSSIAKRSREPK